MNKIKDEVFVINQPSHALLSIIFLDSEFPLAEGVHNNIFKLCDISDVVFIFSDKYFSSKRVNKMKFSSIYKSCCWINSKDSLPATLLKFFEYDFEIFKNHVGYMIMNSSDLGKVDIDEKLINNTNKFMREDINNPIFKIKTKTSEEMLDIYGLDEDCEDEDEVERSLFSKVLDKLTTLIKGNKVVKIDEEEDISNMFSTYYSESEILFIKSSVVKSILDFSNSDENKRIRFIESFKYWDIRHFIASIVKYLKLEIYDVNLIDAVVKNERSK